MDKIELVILHNGRGRLSERVRCRRVQYASGLLSWRDQCSASFPRRERQSTAGIHQSPGFPKWLLHRMEEHKPRADDSGLNRILPSGRQHKVCRFYKGQSERASGFRFNQNSPTQEKKKSVRAGLSFIASLDLMSTFSALIN